MVLGHDLLIPNEDIRVYREALALINEGYEVTVFCWARRLEKYETKWKAEKDLHLFGISLNSDSS